MRLVDYWCSPEFDLHEQLIEAIREQLSARATGGPGWTVYYGQGAVAALSSMRPGTVRKLLALIAKRKETEGAGIVGPNRFIPDICAGSFRTQRQAEALVNSMYEFLPLVDECGITVGALYRLILGLPHNRERIVSSRTRERRRESAALLRLLARGTAHRNPRGAELRGVTAHGIEIALQDTKLRELAVAAETPADIDRIARMYWDENESTDRIEARLAHPSALDVGAL